MNIAHAEFSRMRQTSSAAFQVRAHDGHSRLRDVWLDPKALSVFFESTRQIDVQSVRYVPFMRFALADCLQKTIGQDFRDTIRGILLDRSSGGFTVSVQETAQSPDDYVKFGTAVGHLVGSANCDAMSGTYFARFVVNHTDDSDSYLRQAYRNMTLHTDGTFVDEETDWLLMMKFEERDAEGGESRLLHLDDWEDLETFSRHPLASRQILYKAPPSKNAEQVIRRPTFFRHGGGMCISFIDQFAHPESIDEAIYLRNLSSSMEGSGSTKTVGLPVGSLVMLNNLFWLHGRAAFKPNPKLHRELMRQRGRFSMT